MKVTLFIFAVLILFSCNQVQDEHSSNIDSNKIDSINEIKTNELQSDSFLIALSEKVLLLMKNEDFVALSQYFHPEIKIRFSPYSYVNIKSDVEISKENFVNELKNTRSWGSYDGSGEPIIMDTYAYFKKFVYDTDFIKTKEISVNKSEAKGNSINNMSEVYKGCNFIEYYFPGKDPELQGMDWKALRLVFKFVDGKNYLVAIIHDQWTI